MLEDAQHSLDEKAIDIATEALKEATTAKADIDNHEELCALRYEGINKALEKLFEAHSNARKDIIKAAFVILVTIGSAFGFMYDQLQERTKDRLYRSEYNSERHQLDQRLREIEKDHNRDHK